MVTGQENFDKYYAEIYADRWLKLKTSLLLPEQQVQKWNSLTIINKNEPEVEWLTQATWAKKNAEISRTEDGLLAYYILDPASVLCAKSLEVEPGHKVLDLCAAPGGKSLILAQDLFAHENTNSELILNELSMPRRERLTKVIQNYIPKKFRTQIWVKGNDGAILAMKNPNRFDRILLDAPCSGERHLLKNPKELLQWKKSRSQTLANKQYSLLAGASLALKPRGRIVYSTCSISPLENDRLIEKFMKKKGAQFKVIPFLSTQNNPQILLMAEPTEHGVIFLPDHCGFGPLYFCQIEKLI
jgi:16S rRNA C967 or C1407 C5-methylase (RsmB/RsmF family)